MSRDYPRGALRWACRGGGGVVTPFEQYVGQQLARWDDGRGDMAHDVLYRIWSVYERYYGDLPEVEW